MTDQTSCAYSCPRCGMHARMDYRDHAGGMWAHVKCPMCGCKFDVKMQVNRKVITVDEQARRAVAGLTNRQRAALMRVLSEVDE